jgi:membrane-bound lytic murein transglycosylase D
MKKHLTPWSTIGILAALVIIARGLSFFTESESVLPSSAPALEIPREMMFAGEIVPMQDVDVRERLDRELLVNTYWHSNTLLGFKRANRYFPIIEPILKKHGVPDDFKYLALIESGLTNVVSPAGATGFWQIMKATAQQYGLEVSKEIDERYHLEKSTEVACVYLLDAKAKFGSWTAAAASYNMGMGGLSKQMNRQKSNNYYDLLLNHETSRYVFRIIAVKEIYENPGRYGFKFSPSDLYVPVPTNQITISPPIEDFSEFALEQGISYKALKIHNPWLRENFLKSGNQLSYKIEIPLNGYYRFGDADFSISPLLEDAENLLEGADVENE